MCGDVAQEEQQTMKTQAALHDLMLTFAESTGAYLASGRPARPEKVSGHAL